MKREVVEASFMLVSLLLLPLCNLLRACLNFDRLRLTLDCEESSFFMKRLVCNLVQPVKCVKSLLPLTCVSSLRLFLSDISLIVSRTFNECCEVPVFSTRKLFCLKGCLLTEDLLKIDLVAVSEINCGYESALCMVYCGALCLAAVSVFSLAIISRTLVDR